jgi:hypothetical protein
MIRVLSIYLLLIFFLLTGCATVPPAKHDFQSIMIYNASYDKVWKQLLSFFKDREITLPIAEKESGLIVTEELKIPYRGFAYQSDYCDCGRPGGFYVFHEIIGKINVIVKKLSEDKTSVEVSTNYRASKWLGSNFKGWVMCESKGFAEKRILTYLESHLSKPL